MKIKFYSILPCLIIALLLIISLIILDFNKVTEKNNPSSPIKPVRKTEKFARSGHLGNYSITIPSNVVLVGWVHYINDPQHIDFVKKTQEYPSRQTKTEQELLIKPFAFDMRITDGAVRKFNHHTEKAWYADHQKYTPKDKPFPWSLVHVKATQADKPLDYNDYLNRSLQCGTQKEYFCTYKKHNPLHGLETYRSNNNINSNTAKRWKSGSWGGDIFVRRSAQQTNKVQTLIKCNKKEDDVPVLRCYHHFIIAEMQAEIELRYNRQYLPQWQTLEQHVKQTLSNWVVKNSNELF